MIQLLIIFSHPIVCSSGSCVSLISINSAPNNNCAFDAAYQTASKSFTFIEKIGSGCSAGPSPCTLGQNYLIIDETSYTFPNNYLYYLCISTSNAMIPCQEVLSYDVLNAKYHHLFISTIINAQTRECKPLSTCTHYPKAQTSNSLFINPNVDTYVCGDVFSDFTDYNTMIGFQIGFTTNYLNSMSIVLAPSNPTVQQTPLPILNQNCAFKVAPIKLPTEVYVCADLSCKNFQKAFGMTSNLLSLKLIPLNPIHSKGYCVESCGGQYAVFDNVHTEAYCSDTCQIGYFTSQDGNNKYCNSTINDQFESITQNGNYFELSTQPCTYVYSLSPKPLTCQLSCQFVILTSPPSLCVSQCNNFYEIIGSIRQCKLDCNSNSISVKFQKLCTSCSLPIVFMTQKYCNDCNGNASFLISTTKAVIKSECITLCRYPLVYNPDYKMCFNGSCADLQSTDKTNLFNIFTDAICKANCEFTIIQDISGIATTYCTDCLSIDGRYRILQDGTCTHNLPVDCIKMWIYATYITCSNTDYPCSQIDAELWYQQDLSIPKQCQKQCLLGKNIIFNDISLPNDENLCQYQGTTINKFLIQFMNTAYYTYSDSCIGPQIILLLEQMYCLPDQQSCITERIGFIQLNVYKYCSVCSLQQMMIKMHSASQYSCVSKQTISCKFIFQNQMCSDSNDPAHASCLNVQKQTSFLDQQQIYKEGLYCKSKDSCTTDYYLIQFDGSSFSDSNICSNECKFEIVATYPDNSPQKCVRFLENDLNQFLINNEASFECNNYYFSNNQYQCVQQCQLYFKEIDTNQNQCLQSCGEILLFDEVFNIQTPQHPQKCSECLINQYQFKEYSTYKCYKQCPSQSIYHISGSINSLQLQCTTVCDSVLFNIDNKLICNKCEDYLTFVSSKFGCDDICNTNWLFRSINICSDLDCSNYKFFSFEPLKYTISDKICGSTCENFNFVDINNICVDCSLKIIHNDTQFEKYQLCDSQCLNYKFVNQNMQQFCLKQCDYSNFVDETNKQCINACPSGYKIQNNFKVCDTCTYYHKQDDLSQLCVSNCPINNRYLLFDSNPIGQCVNISNCLVQQSTIQFILNLTYYCSTCSLPILIQIDQTMQQCSTSCSSNFQISNIKVCDSQTISCNSSFMFGLNKNIQLSNVPTQCVDYCSNFIQYDGINKISICSDCNSNNNLQTQINNSCLTKEEYIKCSDFNLKYYQAYNSGTDNYYKCLNECDESLQSPMYINNLLCQASCTPLAVNQSGFCVNFESEFCMRFLEISSFYKCVNKCSSLYLLNISNQTCVFNSQCSDQDQIRSNLGLQIQFVDFCLANLYIPDSKIVYLDRFQGAYLFLDYCEYYLFKYSDKIVCIDFNCEEYVLRNPIDDTAYQLYGKQVFIDQNTLKYCVSECPSTKKFVIQVGIQKQCTDCISNLHFRHVGLSNPVCASVITVNQCDKIQIIKFDTNTIFQCYEDCPAPLVLYEDYILRSPRIMQHDFCLQKCYDLFMDEDKCVSYSQCPQNYYFQVQVDDLICVEECFGNFTVFRNSQRECNPKCNHIIINGFASKICNACENRLLHIDNTALHAASCSTEICTMNRIFVQTTPVLCFQSSVTDCSEVKIFNMLFFNSVFKQGTNPFNCTTQCDNTVNIDTNECDKCTGSWILWQIAPNNKYCYVESGVQTIYEYFETQNTICHRFFQVSTNNMSCVNNSCFFDNKQHFLVENVQCSSDCTNLTDYQYNFVNASYFCTLDCPIAQPFLFFISDTKKQCVDRCETYILDGNSPINCLQTQIDCQNSNKIKFEAQNFCHDCSELLIINPINIFESVCKTIDECIYSFLRKTSITQGICSQINCSTNISQFTQNYIYNKNGVCFENCNSLYIMNMSCMDCNSNGQFRYFQEQNYCSNSQPAQELCKTYQQILNGDQYYYQCAAACLPPLKSDITKEVIKCVDSCPSETFLDISKLSCGKSCSVGQYFILKSYEYQCLAECTKIGSAINSSVIECLYDDCDQCISLQGNKCDYCNCSAIEFKFNRKVFCPLDCTGQVFFDGQNSYQCIQNSQFCNQSMLQIQTVTISYCTIIPCKQNSLSFKNIFAEFQFQQNINSQQLCLKNCDGLLFYISNENICSNCLNGYRINKQQEINCSNSKPVNCFKIIIFTDYNQCVDDCPYPLFNQHDVCVTQCNEGYFIDGIDCVLTPCSQFYLYNKTCQFDSGQFYVSTTNHKLLYESCTTNNILILSSNKFCIDCDQIQIVIDSINHIFQCQPFCQYFNYHDICILQNCQSFATQAVYLNKLEYLNNSKCVLTCQFYYANNNQCTFCNNSGEYQHLNGICSQIPCNKYVHNDKGGFYKCVLSCNEYYVQLSNLNIQCVSECDVYQYVNNKQCVEVCTNMKYFNTCIDSVQHNQYLNALDNQTVTDVCQEISTFYFNNINYCFGQCNYIYSFEEIITNSKCLIQCGMNRLNVGNKFCYPTLSYECQQLFMFNTNLKAFQYKNTNICVKECPTESQFISTNQSICSNCENDGYKNNSFPPMCVSSCTFPLQFIHFDTCVPNCELYHLSGYCMQQCDNFIANFECVSLCQKFTVDNKYCSDSIEDNYLIITDNIEQKQKQVVSNCPNSYDVLLDTQKICFSCSTYFMIMKQQYKCVNYADSSLLIVANYIQIDFNCSSAITSFINHFSSFKYRNNQKCVEQCDIYQQIESETYCTNCSFGFVYKNVCHQEPNALCHFWNQNKCVESCPIYYYEKQCLDFCNLRIQTQCVDTCQDQYPFQYQNQCFSTSQNLIIEAASLILTDTCNSFTFIILNQIWCYDCTNQLLIQLQNNTFSCNNELECIFYIYEDTICIDIPCNQAFLISTFQSYQYLSVSNNKYCLKYCEQNYRFINQIKKCGECQNEEYILISGQCNQQRDIDCYYYITMPNNIYKCVKSCLIENLFINNSECINKCDLFVTINKVCVQECQYYIKQIHQSNDKLCSDYNKSFAIDVVSMMEIYLINQCLEQQFDIIEFNSKFYCISCTNYLFISFEQLLCSNDCQFNQFNKMCSQFSCSDLNYLLLHRKSNVYNGVQYDQQFGQCLEQCQQYVYTTNVELYCTQCNQPNKYPTLSQFLFQNSLMIPQQCFSSNKCQYVNNISMNVFQCSEECLQRINGIYCQQKCSEFQFLLNNNCLQNCPFSLYIVINDENQCIQQCQSYFIRNMNNNECILDCLYFIDYFTNECIIDANSDIQIQIQGQLYVFLCKYQTQYLMISQKYQFQCIFKVNQCQHLIINNKVCLENTSCAYNAELFKNTELQMNIFTDQNEQKCLQSCNSFYYSNFTCTPCKSPQFVLNDQCFVEKPQSQDCQFIQLDKNSIQKCQQNCNMYQYVANEVLYCTEQCPSSHPNIKTNTCLIWCQFYIRNGLNNTCVDKCNLTFAVTGMCTNINQSCFYFIDNNTYCSDCELFLQLVNSKFSCSQECKFFIHNNFLCSDLNCSHEPTLFYQQKNQYNVYDQNNICSPCPQFIEIYTLTCIQTCIYKYFMADKTCSACNSSLLYRHLNFYCSNEREESMCPVYNYNGVYFQCLLSCDDLSLNGQCVPSCPTWQQFVIDSKCVQSCPNKSYALTQSQFTCIDDCNHFTVLYQYNGYSECAQNCFYYLVKNKGKQCVTWCTYSQISCVVSVTPVQCAGIQKSDSCIATSECVWKIENDVCFSEQKCKVNEILMGLQCVLFKKQLYVKHLFQKVAVDKCFGLLVQQKCIQFKCQSGKVWVDNGCYQYTECKNEKDGICLNYLIQNNEEWEQV